MQDYEDPLAQFGLEAIDLRWTLKDIAAKRWILTPVDPVHLERLIGLGVVEMRDGLPALTSLGQSVMWKE